MDLSIIIVSYNTKELLVDCLRSIQKAVQFISAEVFVVDNNSSDGTVSLIKKKFPKIKLKANKQNLGFSKANNQALTLIRGKYVLILNPDTKLMSDTITKMIDFMQDNPQVTVSTCKVELPNGQLDRDCRRHFPTPWRAFCHFSGLSKIFACSKIFDQYYYGYLPDDHQHGAASGMKPISADLTKATKESKRKALYESVHAMEIFYKKHHQDQYPFLISWMVYLGFWILLRIRLLSV